MRLTTPLLPPCSRALRASAFATAVVVALAATASAAELQVVATQPARNVMAPARTAVRIDFDQPVDPATVSAATVRVFGRGSGTAAGTLTLSNGDRSVTLTPARAFSAGEI